MPTSGFSTSVGCCVKSHDLTTIEKKNSPALNPFLYERLREIFGEVHIAKPGSPLLGGDYTWEYGKMHFSPLDAGEYYCVCCPFCRQKGGHDSKYRLWINHRWGVGLDASDPRKQQKPDDRFWFMAVCYNENCMVNWENVKALRTMVYDSLGRERRAEEIKILPVSDNQASLGIVRLPGKCLRVDQLTRNHQAYQYLLSRGLDPQRLGQDYDVSYCLSADPEFAQVASRLIIPIYMRGTLVGWQARPPFDTDWKMARLPKYYNCPRTNKRLMLYGFDNARTLPYCIVVEGVTDVWAIGAGAVALLGKIMSPQQFELILGNWKAAVVILDSDAHKEIEHIRQLCDGRMPCVPVLLPQGLDPATIDQDYLWDLVHASASQNNVNLEGLSK